MAQFLFTKDVATQREAFKAGMPLPRIYTEPWIVKWFREHYGDCLKEVDFRRPADFTAALSNEQLDSRLRELERENQRLRALLKAKGETKED